MSCRWVSSPWYVLKAETFSWQDSLLYGLPKVHEPNVPQHLIMSFVHVSSPIYHLSKFLADLLQLVVSRTSSHVNNSGNLWILSSHRCWPVKRPRCPMMWSLFTCTPTDLAVWDWVPRWRLENDVFLSEHTSLSGDDIVDKVAYVCQ